MIAASSASTSAILARVCAVVVLLSRTSNYSCALAGHVSSLAASNASAGVCAIRLKEVLPPAIIAVVAPVVKCCNSLVLIPVPLPNPVIWPLVVANVWRHLRSFYVWMIRLVVIVLSMLARSQVRRVLVAGADWIPTPTIATGCIVNLKLVVCRGEG